MSQKGFCSFFCLTSLLFPSVECNLKIEEKKKKKKKKVNTTFHPSLPILAPEFQELIKEYEKDPQAFREKHSTVRKRKFGLPFSIFPKKRK